ncbi:DAK2 domain-containing protein [Marinicrinis sediminis]|uniref:DAK2 domain-containing protein n=1 Tax=Marinicrinis sediminis TaxID=1652465 RepID=A0ABW5R604_9BACL
MSKRFINGMDFANMVYSAADVLKSQVETVNGLNVFPVPDGDTGTNMNMTLTSGVEMLRRKQSEHLGQNAEALSKGLLMGARGNSGVILSQLFRGFAKGAAGLEQMDVHQFAAALQSGVDMAYQAVVKPVEGTILTVSREAAKHAQQAAKRNAEMEAFMADVLDKAKEALANTPNQLPVLKQVGVVDSGGQGLVFVYEGFLAVLRNGASVPHQADFGRTNYSPIAVQIDEPVVSRAAQELQESAQAKLATEDIEFLYDMEFFIDIAERKVPGTTFDEEGFRTELAKDGDSILVIVDDEQVKVHVHSRKPGDVFNLAMKYGELNRFHIENMREQHRKIIDEPAKGAADSASPEAFVAETSDVEKKPFGLVAVAVGEGITEIFNSIGVDYVLSGGQTMNPSTEDILQAIEQVEAEHVFILPNNSNIILAAQQAKEVCETTEISVIPTKTIPQGMAAAIAFQESESAEVNEDLMIRATKLVRSGQITQSIRDTTIDEVEIHEGDYLAIVDGKITAAKADLMEAIQQLVAKMFEEGDEVMTILTGAQADEEATSQIIAHIETEYPDVELDVLEGGQPLYPYLFSVE